MNLSKHMIRMLKIIECVDGHGYPEIECHWGGYETGNDTRDIFLNSMVVRNVCNALIRRGLATDQNDFATGPILTPEGERVLQELKAKGKIK